MGNHHCAPCDEEADDDGLASKQGKQAQHGKLASSPWGTVHLHRERLDRFNKKKEERLAAMNASATCVTSTGTPSDAEEAGGSRTSRMTPGMDWGRWLFDRVCQPIRGVARRDVGAVLFLRLVYQFLDRALASMATFYLLERFGLSPGQLGRMGGFQGLIVLAIQASGVAVLVRAQGEHRVVVGATLATALVCLVESTEISVDTYTWLVLPAKTLVAAVARPCLSSMFVGAVPASDRGAALGGLDVLLSAVGVVAPLAGGWALARLGARGQFVAAAAGYLVAALVMVVGGGAGGIGVADEEREVLKEENEEGRTSHRSPDSSAVAGRSCQGRLIVQRAKVE